MENKVQTGVIDGVIYRVDTKHGITQRIIGFIPKILHDPTRFPSKP